VIRKSSGLCPLCVCARLEPDSTKPIKTKKKSQESTITAAPISHPATRHAVPLILPRHGIASWKQPTAECVLLPVWNVDGGGSAMMLGGAGAVLSAHRTFTLILQRDKRQAGAGRACDRRAGGPCKSNYCRFQARVWRLPAYPSPKTSQSMLFPPRQFHPAQIIDA